MILDRFAITDKVAVVTGAGRGIGASCAVSLAEAGADVVIAARTAGQLDDVAARIVAAGRRAVAVAADLSDLEAVAGLVDRARQEFGRLDVVVNNVGGAMPRPFMDTSPGRLEQAFHFNVSTAHALLRPAVPLHARGRRRLGRQHLLGHGAPVGPRVRGLRHGEGSAGPLHPAGRRRPVPPHPGQRHRRRVGGHLGPGHRHADRRAPGGAGDGHPARPDRGTRGHRRRRRLSGLRGRLVRHRQDPRGRRWHRGAQPRPGPARPLSGRTPTRDRPPERGHHDTALPSRRLEHRQRRPARHRRHRRPPRPRAGRAVGVQSRQGRS